MSKRYENWTAEQFRDRLIQMVKEWSENHDIPSVKCLIGDIETHFDPEFWVEEEPDVKFGDTE